ncbi:kinase-like domain-containing protein [Mycena metata]|uniref:Kinase-like domain-containing protein n=1 Tax=Mycena metata TaxID=1033252 RepID=A0AAD7NI43_9AGAR|nr:kinase-like domain-containing protein [Mycena metata]KAJ7760957.1 kinase-like domain-containing protein [Mycena metata]
MATEPVEMEDVPMQSEHEVNGLQTEELFWRNHQLWLQECGFMLRPRFRRDWVPSWQTDPKLVPFLCEDAIPLAATQIVDAIRVEDGASVALKLISKSVHPEEAEIFEYFSTPELRADPRNHCLPLLDTLSPPDDEDKLIFVMKLMRKYDSPRFDTFGEVMEFFRQMFEGMQFMHHHRVAHRDGNSNNIMMDGQHLFPSGFHPQYQRYERGAEKGMFKFRKAKHYTRTQRPVKYYFIDFGISCKFGPGEDTRAYPIMGGDRSPPEFGVRESEFANPTVGKLDPFATDIYYLGNLICRDFLDGYPPLAVARKLGFEFMRPLVSDMVQSDPVKRPTIDQVVSRFQEIHSGLSWWKLRSRVVKETEVTAWHLRRLMIHWVRKVGFVLRRVPAMPAPSP